MPLDGPILGIESGDLLGLGYNFTIVLTSNSVHVYAQPGFSKADIAR